MQSCIRLQNFLHFSHVTRSHFSFRYTNFTSLTFPQRPRQQGSGILILQAYSKRGKETGRSRNVHPLVPEGSTKTYGILTSHVAWRQPQQNKGGWRRITRRPQEETKAAFKGGQGHGGRMLVEETHQHRLSQSSALAGRGSQRPHTRTCTAPGPHSLPDTANGNGS